MNYCWICGTEIPKNVQVDGKLVNLNHRKRCIQCCKLSQHQFPEDSERRRSDGDGKNKQCNSCGDIKLLDEFYFWKKRYQYSSQCKACVSYARIIWGRKSKQKYVDYKGGKCEKCGYKKCLASLDFHHIDTTTKDREIDFTGAFSESIKKELDKCVLLCANCHRETHYNITKQNNQQLSKKIEKYKELSNKTGFKRFNPQTKFTHPRPNKVDLAKLVWEIPINKIAQMFNVDRGTVMRWLKMDSTEHPKPGYWQKIKYGKI